MTATPALDALASEARSFLASHWDEIAADGAASSHDRRQRAAEAAARSACAIGPPEAGTTAATDDQLARAARVLAAHGEMARLARGDSPDALVARGQVALITGSPASPPRLTDVEAASELARICTVVAQYLALRPDGLLDDVVDLARGAADLDGRVW